MTSFCELINDSAVDAWWSVLLLENSELLFGRLCVIGLSGAILSLEYLITHAKVLRSLVNPFRFSWPHPTNIAR